MLVNGAAPSPLPWAAPSSSRRAWDPLEDASSLPFMMSLLNTDSALLVRASDPLSVVRGWSKDLLLPLLLLSPDSIGKEAMANILTRLLTLPLTLISLIFTRILRFRGVPYLRLSWPSSSSSSGTNPSSSANGSSGNANGANGDDEQHFIDPTEASEHFVRYLKANDETADGSAVDRDLWFTRGGYNAALTRAKEDNKILLVVLISKEHDDNAAFLR